jgi:hypothetical protein
MATAAGGDDSGLRCGVVWSVAWLISRVLAALVEDRGGLWRGSSAVCSRRSWRTVAPISLGARNLVRELTLSLRSGSLRYHGAIQTSSVCAAANPVGNNEMLGLSPNRVVTDTQTHTHTDKGAYRGELTATA